MLTGFCDSTTGGRLTFSSPAGGTTVWSLAGTDSTFGCTDGAGGSG